MSFDLDPLDDKILKILQADSRRPFVEIAGEIGLSESAVRRRVKNMVNNGVIAQFTIELGASEKTSAITLVSVSSSSDTSSVSSDLKKLGGVQVIYEITGQYDIAVILTAPTIGEINKYIDDVRKTAGVSDTNTVIVLKTLR
ncbi:MAG: Lrp/AsnC family transcriptional regulator [Candidatus Nitrosopolaris sp.]|jgi:Lrp/AsnC family transcriptional regulator, regulator for asnA, asnC and gidA